MELWKIHKWLSLPACLPRMMVSVAPRILLVDSCYSVDGHQQGIMEWVREIFLILMRDLGPTLILIELISLNPLVNVGFRGHMLTCTFVASYFFLFNFF